MISVKDLTKTYGTFKALKGLSFEIDKGEVVGFLGPNGAGKTTTMRVLSCYMPADSGTVEVTGYDVFHSSLEVKKRVGYLPEIVPLYPEMTVSGYLNYVAQIKDIPYHQRSERLDFVLEACGLKDRRRQITGQLSKGYRQRVGLAQSLIHDPEVIILDEPTSGLDPRQIIEIRELIRELGQNRTVILSTHILAEASMTCQRMLVIHEGKIAGDIELVDQKPLLRSHDIEGFATNERYIRLVVQGKLEIIQNTLDELTLSYTLSNQESDIYTFQVVPRVNADRNGDLRPQVAKALIHQGCQLLEIAVVESTLEEIFLQLTTG